MVGFVVICQGMALHMMGLNLSSSTVRQATPILDAGAALYMYGPLAILASSRPPERVLSVTPLAELPEELPAPAVPPLLPPPTTACLAKEKSCWKGFLLLGLGALLVAGPGLVSPVAGGWGSHMTPAHAGYSL